jgi:hypothetical protein
MMHEFRALADGAAGKMKMLRGILLAAALAASAFATPAPAAGVTGNPNDGSAITKGGMQGAQTLLLHVTTLANSGRGSLREALETEGARVIVFDVGGRIMLTQDLVIRYPMITIAGQSAPAPGISLWGASLRIRTHDVIVQHIAVRPGPAKTPAENDNRDGLSIDGYSRSKSNPVSYNVLVENVSVSWSVDEALSLWFEGTSHVTIRNCIIAEALDNAGHPKGPHSMGLLLGSGTGPSQVTGNLLASNRYRNPLVGQGATAYVANNYIVNPGWNAIHTYDTGSSLATRATIVNNVIEPGHDTQSKLTGIVLRTSATGSSNQFYVDGNQDLNFGPLMRPIVYALDLKAAKAPPITASDWTLLPASKVKNYVLVRAGTRPLARDPVDARLLKQIAAGAERIIDHPADPGPLPKIKSTAAKAGVPARPFDVARNIRKTRLEIWLCMKHLELGGVHSQTCPESLATLKKALAS